MKGKLISSYNTNKGRKEKKETKFPEFTTASKAHSKYHVLRTSIPLSIRSLLDINEGNILKWNIITLKGKIVVTFEKTTEKKPRKKTS